MAAFIARDTHNVSAALRNGGPMKQGRNKPEARGGARNHQAEWMAEADELAGIEEEAEADACMAGLPCVTCGGSYDFR